MREGLAREWRGSQAAMPMHLARVRTMVAEGLGFGAGGETVRLVRLENGDGGRDDDSLCFYVAITIPQIPLSEIDVVVNQFSARRARERERDLIFGSCWWHSWARGFHFCLKSNFRAGRSPPRLTSGEQRPNFI